METNLNSKQKGKKFKLELVDLLTGAAFPLMLMIILSSLIMSFASSEDITLDIIIVVLGEISISTALIIFGRQNGIVAYRKTIQQSKKRDIGTNDLKALLGVGEYSVYKGFVIGFISCVPYIIFQIVNNIFPNSFCEFLLQYAFGWAYYPLSFVNASAWLNLLWVIPAVCIHALAYYIGGATEEKRQNAVIEAQESKDKKKKS